MPMYVLGPSIQLRPATVSSSVQIASMKEEKELSPREGGREGGNLLSCPQNEMGGERGGEKKEKEWTGRKTDPDIREACTLSLRNHKISKSHSEIDE